MGLADAFGTEDRVSVPFSSFYRMMETAAKAEAKAQYIENAVKANVPNHHIQSMLDGEMHCPPEDLWLNRGCMFGGEEPETDA